LPEPISTFILTTAAGVLSEVITDMIRGGKSAARRKEIEHEISKILMQRGGISPSQMRVILRDVLDEIKLLALKDPVLSVSEEGVGRVKPIRSRLPFGRKKKVERALGEHLKQLEKAITHRRQELGLPLRSAETDAGDHAQGNLNSSEESATCPKGEGLASLEWDAAAPKSPRSEWYEQIRITRDRVRRRRHGEILDD